MSGSIEVRGGESTSLTVTYVVPDLVRTIEGAKEIVLRVVPQPTLAGVRYQLRVALPDGSIIVSASPGLERRGDTATFSGVRGGPWISSPFRRRTALAEDRRGEDLGFPVGCLGHRDLFHGDRLDLHGL